MRKHLFYSLMSCLISLGLFMSPAWSDDISPLPMLNKVINGVLGDIKQRRVELKNNTKELYGLVERQVLPHIDFDEVAKWIAGRTIWQSAEPKLKEEFVAVFKGVLLRTYAQTLINDSYEKVEFLPLREMIGEKKRVQISSLLIDSNGRLLHIDYRVIRHANQWLVYDVVIEGVSLLKGYQAQFSDLIRQKGLSAMIQELRYQTKERIGS